MSSSPIIYHLSLLPSSTEHAVSGIAEAGSDVGVFVELAVEECHEDIDVGVVSLQPSNALWRRDETDERDARRAPTFERCDRRRGRPAGGQHRVEDHHEIVRTGFREAVVVALRQMGRFVPLETEMPDLRLRKD